MTNNLICEWCEKPYSEPKLLTTTEDMYLGLCHECLEDDFLKCSYCSTLVDYNHPDITDTAYLNMLLDLDKKEDFVCPMCASKANNVYHYTHQQLVDYFGIINPFEEYGIWGQ